MKNKWFLNPLLSLILFACTNEAVPNTPNPAPPISSSLFQPTETSIPVAMLIPSLTPETTVTSAPTQTMAPTISPDLGLLPWEESGIMEPNSDSQTEWCGVPIMDTALTGGIVDQTNYVYKTGSPPMDVYQYYLSEMPNLNWELYLIGTDAVNATPVENANLDEFHPMLFYQKDSFSEQSAITLLGDFTNNLIYVMIICGG